MLTNINHITFAVNDVDVSFDFYTNILGFTPRATWNSGAYLSLGHLWLCLSVDRVDTKQDYTHYAFNIEEREMAAFKEKLKAFEVSEWKTNKSEGESVYFLDPDGHKLEAHCGNLESRLNSCKDKPYAGMNFF
ncbi:fosfomycin resistance glutathione transferase [Salmonella enterica]|nr:fosfomycin resistance glutathione transferase [Salmonella enterica]